MLSDDCGPAPFLGSHYHLKLITGATEDERAGIVAKSSSYARETGPEGIPVASSAWGPIERDRHGGRRD